MYSGLTDSIRDIHSLDPVGLWPVAPGWWLVLAGALLGGWLLYLALRFVSRYPFFTWHSSARRQLIRLRQRSATEPAATVAAELSELLRRIAIARCGREACAGLAGVAWLDWLSANDPAGFDWRKAGKPLLVLPYAPAGTAGDADTLRTLIEAAIPWARRESRLPARLRGLWPRTARV
jgi:Domain of unknown function (DUF4381)